MPAGLHTRLLLNSDALMSHSYIQQNVLRGVLLYH